MNASLPVRVTRSPVALGLLVPALLVSGCAPNARPRNARMPVTVARAELRTVPLMLTATGTIEAAQNADVGSQVGGVVTRIRFAEGQEVRAGQVLIELDPRPFRNALEQAQATLARDRAQAENARREAGRARQLLEQNLLSRSEFELKISNAEAMAATVRADSAQASAARLNLQYATIRAPVSGQTGRLMVHVGDLVRAATSEALVTVVQMRPVRVRFSIPVGDVPLVQRYRDRRPRVQVRVPGPDSTDREGILVFVDNTVDATSGTLLLKGELPNKDGALVPGQFVDVRLVLEEQMNKVVVPSQSVSRGQEGTFVYVLAADSTVTTRPVVVERAMDDITVVASGLEAGETVVTDGQLRLSPGSRVIVRKAGSSR
ncbi:MAG: efflux RND transporter periplasmic adaptor subunit [Candidatus Eisenbacteria bacterium]